MARPRIISDGPTEQTSFRVAWEELQQAKEICKQLDVSLAQFLREAMMEKIERVNNG